MGKIIGRLDLVADYTTERYRRSVIGYAQGLLAGPFMQFCPFDRSSSGLTEHDGGNRGRVFHGTHGVGHIGWQMHELLGAQFMHGLADENFEPTFQALQTDAARHAMRRQRLAERSTTRMTSRSSALKSTLE